MLVVIAIWTYNWNNVGRVRVFFFSFPFFSSSFKLFSFLIVFFCFVPIHSFVRGKLPTTAINFHFLFPFILLDYFRNRCLLYILLLLLLSAVSYRIDDSVIIILNYFLLLTLKVKKTVSAFHLPIVLFSSSANGSSDCYCEKCARLLSSVFLLRGFSFRFCRVENDLRRSNQYDWWTESLQ